MNEIMIEFYCHFTCLRWDFNFIQQFSTILGLLKNIRMREEGRLRQEQGQMMPPTVNRSVPQPIGYSRYDQERFKGKEGWFIYILFSSIFFYMKLVNYMLVFFFLLSNFFFFVLVCRYGGI